MTTTRPARTLRSLLLAAAILVSGAAGATVVADPADAAVVLTPAEQDYVNRINALRASLGLGTLQVDDNLVELSRAHTTEMADARRLYHTVDLTAGVTTPNWEKLTENVGFGSNTPLVWNAFLNSPGHYGNIIDPTLTHVGVGVVERDGLQWTTHRFMQIGRPPPPPIPNVTVPRTPTTQAPPPPPTAPKVSIPPIPKATTTTTAAPAPAPVAPPAPPANPKRVATVLIALRAV